MYTRGFEIKRSKHTRAGRQDSGTVEMVDDKLQSGNNALNKSGSYLMCNSSDCFVSFMINTHILNVGGGESSTSMFVVDDNV